VARATGFGMLRHVPSRSRKTKPRRLRPWRIVAGVVLFVLLGSFLVVAPWRYLPLPITSFMLQSRFAADAPPLRYDWVPWTRISGNLALCAVASEDQKFPDHHGFDLDSIEKAVQGGAQRGASTISQQVAKNLYLWPGRSFVRKGIEAWLTVWIELLWPKKRILEVYLNIAEFGPGVYGAEAASAWAFGKRADELTMQEAATLVAVLPNPKRMSAKRPGPYVRERSRQIVRSAGQLGMGVLRKL
jgi:monofunctional biosynthetic peptidoglycan transglycosylase